MVHLIDPWLSDCKMHAILFIDIIRKVQAVSALCLRNLKTEPHQNNKCFPSELCLRNFKRQQLLAILNLCLNETRAGKSHNCHTVY